MSIAWLIFVTGVVIFIQSYLYKKWGLSKIEYHRSFSQKTAFEGEEIELIDEISNKKLLPLPWLRLESKIDVNLQINKEEQENAESDSEAHHRTLFSLMPYQKITRKHKIFCKQRGYYSLKTVSIATGDAFGIFQGKFRVIESFTDVTVYPKLTPIEEIGVPSHSWLGDITVRRWIMEDPFVFAGVREYAHGDTMNTVNWKATARTGNLQVSKKDFTADHQLMIYLNFDESEDIWLPVSNIELMEKGISFAASIAHYAIEQGMNTGFGCNGYLVEPFGRKEDRKSVRIEPSSSKQQLHFIWDTLAKLKIDRSMNFNYFLLEDVEQQVENKDILLITSILTDNMNKRIRQLEAMGNSVEIVWLENHSQVRASGQEGDRYAN